MMTGLKPQLAIELGGKTRAVAFGIPECLALAKRLDGKDPLSFLLEGGDSLTFCVEALFCGLADKRADRVDPAQVGEWLGAWDGDLADLQWDLMFLWARAQPKKRAADLVAVLDRTRVNQKLPPHAWGAETPPVPTPAG